MSTTEKILIVGWALLTGTVMITWPLWWPRMRGVDNRIRAWRAARARVRSAVRAEKAQLRSLATIRAAANGVQADLAELHAHDDLAERLRAAGEVYVLSLSAQERERGYRQFMAAATAHEAQTLAGSERAAEQYENERLKDAFTDGGAR